MKAINFKYILAAILAVFIATVSVGVISANAATAYSGVLEDLRMDEKFNVDDYPQIEDDYSLQIIQLAESAERELFVYVYQPSGKLHFTVIDISTDMQQWNNYRLGLINSAGVFYKYRVIGFTVSEAAERYYDIPNILRKHNSDIDEPPADGQSVSEVGCKVGQFWTATTANDGTVSYSVIANEVIEIKEKVVGYCMYDDGVKLGWGTAEGYTKAYFVAFSSDKPIEKLISADISFCAQKVKFYLCENPKHDHNYLYDMHDVRTIDYGSGLYDDATDFEKDGIDYKFTHNPPLTITHTEKFGNEGGGNIRPAHKYSWNRIRSTSDFIADNNNKDYFLTSGGEEALKGTQWVLNFYEAHDKYLVNNVWVSFIPGVSKLPGVLDGEAEFEMVNDVQILRLEFETEGERFNIGVVDNKQTGNEQFNGFKDRKAPWWVWLIVAVVILFVIGILGAIFKPIGKVVFAPFRLIKKAIKKKRTESKKKQNVPPKEQPK